MAVYTQTSLGGIRGAGTPGLQVLYNLQTSGGLRFGGLTVFGFSFDEVGSEGATLDGSAPATSFYAPLGGIVGGSSADVTFFDIIDIESEGAVAAGHALASHHRFVTGSGGFTIAGRAAVRSKFFYHYLSAGLSGDTPPDYAGISVGYLNHQNPALVNFTFDKLFELVWRTDSAVEVDMDLVWSTGSERSYFYRVIGREKQVDICDPIQVGETCCKKYMMNVHARSITDLCEILKKRSWKWRVESVQKFSRPAENAAIAEDEALGVNHDCNILEEVEICDNLVCAEFCVDFDVKETWGYTSKVQLEAFHDYLGTGNLFVAGSAVAEFVVTPTIYEFVSSGVVTLGGDYYSYGNEVGRGGLIVGGSPAHAASSSWRYVGGERLLETTGQASITDFFVEDASDRVWSNPQYAYSNDGVSATTDISQSVPSGFLVLQGWKFAIPVDHDILGIEVTVKKQATISAEDSEVYLVVGNEIVSDNKAASGAWSIGSEGTVIYGGAGDYWRDPNDVNYLGEWSLTDINSPDFGVAIRVAPLIGNLVAEAQVQHVAMRLIYQPRYYRVVTSGQSRVITQRYRYVSGLDSIEIAGAATYGLTMRFRSTGRGSMGPNFAGVDFSGSYAVALTYTGEGGIATSGAAQFFPGGLTSGGTAAVASSYYAYEGAGITSMGGATVFKLAFQYISATILSVAGSAGVDDRYRQTSTGGVDLAGSGLAKSSNYSWTSSSDPIFVLSQGATYTVSDLGMFKAYVGFTSIVQDLTIVYAEDVVTVVAPVVDTISECGCGDMKLSMPFTLNLNSNNKLSQFIARNNFAFSNTLEMHYNRVNDAWIKNLKYSGFNAAVPLKETWSLLFQLYCTDNVAGESIDGRIWKFHMQVIQQGATTPFADYDTLLVLGFKPGTTCNSGFKIGINVNTQTRSVVFSPTTTLYEFKLQDNIGLFKNPFWIKNPLLSFELSQTGLDTLIPRYPLYV